MHPRHRDGLLAGLGLAGLLAVVVTTADARTVFDPRAVTVGVVGALVVETLFVRYPDRLLAVWERPAVPAVAFVALLAGAVVAGRVAQWLVAALVWGLAVYLGILACVLSGLGNPLAPLGRRRQR